MAILCAISPLFPVAVDFRLPFKSLGFFVAGGLGPALGLGDLSVRFGTFKGAVRLPLLVGVLGFLGTSFDFFGLLGTRFTNGVDILL